MIKSSLRALALTLAGALFVSSAVADTNVFTETFATDPAANGWKTYGDASLFQWDSTNHNLAVTWDSSQTNSYFYRPLGTNLTIADGFSLAFDLQLTNAVAGGDYGFELAVGFFHLADATNSGFLRGTGYQSPNLFEFDYFPPLDGFDGSPNLTFVDSINNFEFFYDDLTFNYGTTYHITLSHIPGSTQAMGAIYVLGTNGLQLVSSFPFSFAGAFTDFVLDTVSISSYDGTDADGSIIAQGTIANIVVTTIPLPVGNITGQFVGGTWQTQFTGRTNWIYTLESSPDLKVWSAASAPLSGSDGTLTLQDTNAPVAQSYYRVHASHP